MPSAPAATAGRVASKVFIAPLKPLPPTAGAAENIVVGDTAVLEHQRRGIRGTDAMLMLELGDSHTRRAGFDHERLHRGAAGVWVDRGPHDHEPGRLLGRHQAAGDEDLLAV